MPDVRIIKRGEIFTITSGGNNDYMIHGVFKACFDINIVKSSWDYLIERPAQSSPFEFRYSQFIQWMEKMGYIEEVVASELYLGQYGCTDTMTVL